MSGGVGRVPVVKCPPGLSCVKWQHHLVVSLGLGLVQLELPELFGLLEGLHLGLGLGLSSEHLDLGVQLGLEQTCSP